MIGDNLINREDSCKIGTPGEGSRNREFPAQIERVGTFERAMITTTLIFSYHWKTHVSFCLRKKRPENACLTLTVNYRKIIQKNKL